MNSQQNPARQDKLEAIAVSDSTIGCDGGGGALGHPMVYLHLNKDGVVDCPYCGRHFYGDAAH